MEETIKTAKKDVFIFGILILKSTSSKLMQMCLLSRVRPGIRNYLSLNPWNFFIFCVRTKKMNVKDYMIISLSKSATGFVRCFHILEKI